MSKTTFRYFLSLFLFSLLALLYSCKQDEGPEFEDVTDAEAGDSTLWNKMDQDTLGNKIAAFDGARGTTWNAWIKIHRECMKNEFFKRPTYLGVSNTMDLGTIVNEYNGLEGRLSNTFSEEEIKSLILEGSYKNCDYRQEISTNIEVVLQSSVDVASVEDALEAELTLAIQNSKKTTMKLEQWRINTLDEGALKKLLRNTGDAAKIQYKTDLQTKGNKFIAAVAEIKGFSMLVEFESEMSAELIARLQQGAVANLGDTGFEASVKYVNNKTVEMSSSNMAYVFVTLRKAKTIKV